LCTATALISATVSFSAASSGSTTSERWQANAAETAPTFTPSSSTTFLQNYYDQLKETFQASTASGGTAMSATNYVTASYVTFGTPSTTEGEQRVVQSTPHPAPGQVKRPIEKHRPRARTNQSAPEQI